MTKRKAVKTAIDRFMAKVDALEAGCWGWVGALRTNGYGVFWDGIH